MNQIVIWEDLRLFYGSIPRPVIKHSHPVLQLVIATKTHFLSKGENGNWIKKKGLLIAPNHTHECDAQNVNIISFDIDPESLLGEWIINNQLKNKKVIDYPIESLPPLDISRFLNYLKTNNWNAIRSLIEYLFNFQKSNKTSQRDIRIKNVLNFITADINKDVNTKLLTEVACLSESRLLHLFKQEMGLPIRNYILWYRLKIVIEQLLQGSSLTEAAYVAGFADQSHMTRTYTKMIGVPPSFLTKNSKFVQVSFP